MESNLNVCYYLYMFFDHIPGNIQGNMNNNTIQVYYDTRVDMETSNIHSHLQNFKIEMLLNLFRHRK
jgi:hypothetical protein